MSWNRKEEKRRFPFGLARRMVATVHGVTTRVRMAWEMVAIISMLSFIVAVCLSGQVVPFMEGTAWARRWSPAFGWVAAAGVVLICAEEIGRRYGWDARWGWLVWMGLAVSAAFLVYAAIFRILLAAVLLAIWTAVSFFLLDEEIVEIVIDSVFNR